MRLNVQIMNFSALPYVIAHNKAMNWDNIRVFIQVNRLGSVAKAATFLALNHSTVLRRLAQLEQELNVQLFIRSTQGYEITPAGEELLEHAVAMENSALVLQRQAASNKTESSGKLDLAIPPPGALDLIPMLAQYRQLHPQIELNLNAQAGLSDLNKLEAEVSIRFTNEPPEDYVGYKVLELPHRLYASKSYLLQHADIKKIEDIQDWIVLSLPKLDTGFEKWIKQLDGGGGISMRVNCTESAAEAVAGGIGVTFLPEHIAKRFANVVEIPHNPFSYSMGIWLLTHRDLRFQPRIKSFIEFMRVALAKRYPEYTVVDS